MDGRPTRDPLTPSSDQEGKRGQRREQHPPGASVRNQQRWLG